LAVGTTTLVSFVGNAISIIVLVLSGFALHTSIVYIDWKLILTLGLGSAVGAVLGVKLTTKIDRKLLTFILAVMAIIPGIYLALSK
jgi:uncharacterized membrane protein YfcA